ncbi:YbjQ family protein [Ideonella sp.]|uniref:YbjQ family protein n=1 Tax=Ideonella sp. TaxID=1929293 RepID=UPI003BB6FCF5
MKLIVSNLEMLPGQRVVRHLGLAQGSTVRAKHVGKDLFAGLKNLVGGELKAYTELMQEARDEAVARMVAEAESMGANAVLNVRFTTTSITMGAAEILAYGSAVTVESL